MKLLSKNENKSYRTKKDRLFSERKNIIANGSKKLQLLLHELLLQKQTNCSKRIFISHMNEPFNPIPGEGGVNQTPITGGRYLLMHKFDFYIKNCHVKLLSPIFVMMSANMTNLCPQSKKTISIQETIQKRKLCHFLTYLRNNNKKC